MSLASELGASVGERLRQRRRALGLTLKEEARQAGISTSYLSAIETGNSVPSLPILARVVGVLGLSLNEVLRDVGRTVVRTGRLATDEPGVRVASHEDLLLEVAFVVSEDGEPGTCPVPTSGHEVFVYVLEGALEVTVDGDPYDLQAGDSLDVDSPDRLEYRPGAARTTAVWAAMVEGDGLRSGPGLRGGR
ncbi:MAG: helix-turn-helix domain-containing protein [Gaiellaceae bacterium]